MNDWRLLLTRPAQECARQAAQLAEAGVFACCLPMLEIEALPDDPQQQRCLEALPEYSALIVVSKPAAQLGLALYQRYWPGAVQMQPWFTVGAATARVLEDAGLQVHCPAQGDDSEALLALPSLAQALAVRTPRVLILRGTTGRDYMAEQLRSRGVQVDYLPLYRRLAPVYAEGQVLQTCRQHGLNGLVASSGEGLANLCASAAADWPQLAELPLFVPSPRVAEQARQAGARQVIDCRGASLQALLQALQKHAPDSSRTTG